MKIISRCISICCAFLFMSSLVSASDNPNDSIYNLRKSLLAYDEIEEVLPMGPYYTSLTATGSMSTVMTILTVEAYARGGDPEIWIDGYDAFRREDISGWAPVILTVDEENRVLVYKHPKTGKTEEFHYGDLIKKDLTGTPDEFPPRVRMKRAFRLARRDFKEPRGGISDTYQASVDKILIRHDFPQEFAYKLRKGIIPEENKLVFPPPNMDIATLWDFRDTEDRTTWEKVQKGLSTVGISGYEHLERPYGKKMPLVGYYLGYTGLCSKEGGTPLTFVRNPQGVFIPSGPELYRMLVKDMTAANDLMVSCEGGNHEFSANIHTFDFENYEIQYRDNKTLGEVLTSQEKSPADPLTPDEFEPLQSKDEIVRIAPLTIFTSTRMNFIERGTMPTVLQYRNSSDTPWREDHQLEVMRKNLHMPEEQATNTFNNFREYLKNVDKETIARRQLR